MVPVGTTAMDWWWPSNITLLALPPYSPELNPVERIWHYLRSHWLANSVFHTLADIMDACEMACNRFATNTGLVRSLCAVAWAPASSVVSGNPYKGWRMDGGMAISVQRPRAKSHRKGPR